MIEEGTHPLHHTREAYEKEKEGRSLFGERRGCAESICRCRKESCGGPRLEDSILPGEIEWGPTSIQHGTVFQLMERPEPRRRGGSDPYNLG